MKEASADKGVGKSPQNTESKTIFLWKQLTEIILDNTLNFSCLKKNKPNLCCNSFKKKALDFWMLTVSTEMQTKICIMYI